MKTLNDILHSVKWSGVYDEILKFAILNDGDDVKYERVFNELLTLVPADNKNDCTIVIDKVTNGKDTEYYYSVSGVENGIEYIEYGIEYCPWNEWLSYYVDDKLFNKMSNKKIVALCLCEMTWAGFTQDEIRGRVN